MKKEVSARDQAIYLKIRKNVSEFIRKQSEVFDSDSIKLLDIAPQIHAGARQYFIKSQIYTADIDSNSSADYIIDICQNNEEHIDSESFDIIVCTEVLEHTLNPFLAIEEIHRLLKKDGILLMSTPFDFRIHGPLPDCWRFTEHGLKTLLKNFKMIDIYCLENKNRFLMPYHYTVVAKK